MSRINSALDMPDVPRGQLPPHLELQRTRVVCRPDAASYVCVHCFLDIFEKRSLFLSLDFKGIGERNYRELLIIGNY